MVVTLIGYRGTGKSSIAEPLADRLGWRFRDADEEIERFARRSIREIFAQQGEPAFRQLERHVMQTLLEMDKLVVAAGGGAVLDADTRRDMRAAGPVIWLTAPVATIMARIADDETTMARRPNLTDQGGRREVETLLQSREPLYRECAEVIVDTDGRDIEGLVDEIVTAIGPRLEEGAAG